MKKFTLPEPEGMFVEIDGIVHRQCSQCKKHKPFETAFSISKKSRRGRFGVCKRCRTAVYYTQNCEEILAKQRACYHTNLVENRAYNRQAKKRLLEKVKQDAVYREKYMETNRLAGQRYRELNKERVRVTRNAYQNERHKNNPNARIAKNLSARIVHMVRRQGTKKHNKTIALLTCSIDYLRGHLESLWGPGMSWKNYGAYRTGGPMTWHIDHKRPCVSFDLTDPEQQKQCFHWSNLQPLWATENMSKGAKL